MSKPIIFYSATDIANFEICKCHIINKIRERLKGTKLKKINPSRTVLEYQKQGEYIEASFLSKLHEHEVVKIEGGNLKERIKNTNESILERKEYIYQACYRDDVKNGIPNVYNIGSGESISLYDFAMKNWIKWKSKGRILRGAYEDREDEVYRFVPDLTGLTNKIK